MAELVFEEVINLTTSEKNISPPLVRSLCMVNEPDNELVQYYIEDSNLAGDKSTTIEYNNYSSAQWGNKKRRLTARNVSRIGVKAFPGVGAIAFFKYKYEDRSMIMCPVNNNNTQFTAPTLTMSTADSKITFTITPPTDITYQCYRIVLANEYFTIEYVTYEKTITIPLPEVKGTYSIYCIGYVDEGQIISFDSNVLSLEITSGKDSFEPDPTISYYTKEQILQLFKEYTPDMSNYYNKTEVDTKIETIEDTIGDITTVVDTINGEEV